MTSQHPRLVVASLLLRGALLALALSTSLLAAPYWITLSGEDRISSLPPWITPGSAALFSIYPAPEADAKLQWFLEDEPLPGQTASTLLLRNVTIAHAGNYRLKITDSSGATYTNTVPLNVASAPPSAIDRSFKATFPTDAFTASIVAVLPNRGVIARVWRDSGSTELVRLDANGHLLGSFQLPHAEASVLTTLLDGRILISHPPFLLQSDGSTSTALALPSGFSATTPLDAVSRQSDGKLIVSQGGRVSRLNSDGTIDPDFAFTVASPTLSISRFTHFTSDASGRIYVSAIATSISSNPQNSPIGFRLLPTGAYDPTFATQVGANANYLSLFPLPDGRVLLNYHANVAAIWSMLQDDGSPDPSWSTPVTTLWGTGAVDAPQLRVFTPDPLRRLQIGATTIEPDHSFYPATPFSVWTTQLVLDSADGLLVSGSFRSWDNHASSFIARLHAHAESVTVPAASISISDIAPARGDRVAFTSEILSGTGPYHYEWRALDGQALPTDHTSHQLVIPSFAPEHLGRYQLRISGPGGSTLSEVITLDGSFQQPHLLAISGRAIAGRDDDTVIAGLKTNAPFRGIVRGVGPSLAPLGVAGYLRNPSIRTFNSFGQPIHENDDWADDPFLANLAVDAGTFPLQVGSKDAALYFADYNSQGSNVTVHLTSPETVRGVALLEIYSAPVSEPFGMPQHPPAALALRAKTSPGEGTTIGGFIVVDPLDLGRTLKVLLRISGPALAAHGVQQPLPDPVLKLFDASGTLIAENDNWSDASDLPALATATDRTGLAAFAAGSKDSALLIELPAGAYTLHASGGTGIVLLEIYSLP